MTTALIFGFGATARTMSSNANGLTARGSWGGLICSSFFGAIVSEQCDGGHFITTSGFSKQAVAFAEGNGIQLSDGEGLSKLMVEAFGEPTALEYRCLCSECGEVVRFMLNKTSAAELTCSKGHSVRNDFDESWCSVASKDGKPTCRQCGKPMRTVRGWRGTFWGCTGYPQCRHTVSSQS